MRHSRNAFLGFLGVFAFMAVVFVITYRDDSGNAFLVLVNRTSLLLMGAPGFLTVSGGFAINVLVSFVVMAIAAPAGFFLGAMMVSNAAITRNLAIVVMNVMRNSPWLVVLYAMLYLLPFKTSLFGYIIYLSPFIKAVAGLSVPVTAYMAEVFRSGIRAIPDGQWESARALGYTRQQIMWSIVLPQALPIMLPNIMTTYAMLFIGTSLIVVTGTTDVMSIGKTVIAADGDRYATAVYLYILLMFFTFAYPLATWSRSLERHLRTQN
jgi:polar amino acid transport system permease protein